MPRIRKITSVVCACGQVFDTQEQLKEHQASGECPSTSIVTPASTVSFPKADFVRIQIPEDEPDTELDAGAVEDQVAQAKMEVHEEEYNKVLAKAIRDAKDKILSEAKMIRESVIAQDSIIIPYSMCDPKIAFLPTTRPVFLNVECIRRDVGLEVVKVKAGWK